MECGFAGNADIFGIGIRIGYYTQALAVWFANYFHFREAQNLRSVNNLFLIALAIVGLIFVYDASTYYAVEAFLLLCIGITIAIISIVDTSRFTSRYMETSNERMLANTVIIVMGRVFLVWFCWKGLEVMRPTPCQGVGKDPSSLATYASGTAEGTYGALVVPVHMYDWFWTLGRVSSLAALLQAVLVIGSADPLRLLHSILTKNTKAAFVAAASSLTPDAIALPQVMSADDAQTRTMTNDLSLGSVSLAADGSMANGLTLGETANTQDRGFPAEMFTKVNEAEQYLDSVFSICRKQEALPGHRREITIFKGHLRFSVPSNDSRRGLNLVPLRRCFHTAFLWYGIGRVPLHLRWRIHSHLTSLDKGPVMVWPRLMYRAFELSNDKNPPDWRMVAIASDVQLYQIPLKKSAKLWAFVAVKNLLLIVLLIIQIELTIAWNHIFGLNQLTSLGQLIPFILGVGGLIKILWSKWRLIKAGCREDTLLLPLSEYEAAMVTYLEWKRIRALRVSSPLPSLEHSFEARNGAAAPTTGAQSIPNDHTT